MTALSDTSGHPARRDLYVILDASPNEATGVLEALHDGQINGYTYAGCLIGTIARLRGLTYTTVPGVTPNTTRPAELLFAHLRTGDTPATSPYAALAAGWIAEWMAGRELAEVAP
jgi:hypothetical protein